MWQTQTVWHQCRLKVSTEKAEKKWQFGVFLRVKDWDNERMVKMWKNKLDQSLNRLNVSILTSRGSSNRGVGTTGSGSDWNVFMEFKYWRKSTFWAEVDQAGTRVGIYIHVTRFSDLFQRVLGEIKECLLHWDTKSCFWKLNLCLVTSKRKINAK